MASTASLRIVDGLVAEGLISRQQADQALDQAHSLGQRVEEVLLEARALDEPTLLEYLARRYSTQFVSTRRLAKADIERSVLELIPKKLAERYTVFPVVFDRQRHVLSVVTPDPDNLAALHEVQVASGARQVRALVARPRAVLAAISKAYAGDIHAFARLDDRERYEQTSLVVGYYERSLDPAEVGTGQLTSKSTPRPAPSEGDKELVITTAVSLSPRCEAESPDWLEAVKVLVSLLEHGRPDLRGHSVQVGGLLGKIAERIGLGASDRCWIALAGYLHDLGKMVGYHLTALNVAEYEAHRVVASKAYHAPLRLLESARIPRVTAQAVEQMYERFDGRGLPAGLSGKEISLGARLLAIADTYSDLTQNPRNPYRQPLPPAQACQVLARYRGSYFDPNLVDLFKTMVTGDDLRARLLANRHRVLVVDPDPEESTVLELRLLEHGFEVVQAHTSDRALSLLERGDFHLVLSELELQPHDGLWLLAEARRQSWGKHLGWVIITGHTGRAEAQRAFELGAADYVTKPVSAEVLVTKLRQLLEREVPAAGRRGVSGSLLEMSLPDIVQILHHGRKTGVLEIRSGGQTGQIGFVAGAIYDARWAGLRGEEAFYAMLRLSEGEFFLDPSQEVTEQLIDLSPEALLLEGMRRLDEAGL